MGDVSKRGHNPDMSGLQERGPKKFKNASEYTSTKECLTPNRKRRQDYKPNNKQYEGGNG